MQRVNILGVGVSAIDMAEAVETVSGWVSRREHHYVCVTSVHGVVECRRDSRLRRIHNAAGLVTPDGMPLVWLCRLRGFRSVERVYGPDLLLAVCRHSAASGRGYRHFFYGAAEGIPQRLAGNLEQRFPGLAVAGACSPPFRPPTAEEDAATVEAINQSKADIVWVGLSTPKQEFWMAGHAGRLEALVLIGVGAAFDFHAGAKKQAPRWMRRSGLEWLFRLATEPRRLWRRYLLTIPTFAGLSLLQAMKLKTYDMD